MIENGVSRCCSVLQGLNFTPSLGLNFTPITCSVPFFGSLKPRAEDGVIGKLMRIRIFIICRPKLALTGVGQPGGGLESSYSSQGVEPCARLLPPPCWC